MSRAQLKVTVAIPLASRCRATRPTVLVADGSDGHEEGGVHLVFAHLGQDLGGVAGHGHPVAVSGKIFWNRCGRPPIVPSSARFQHNHPAVEPGQAQSGATAREGRNDRSVRH
jgi:hypothetical protein